MNRRQIFDTAKTLANRPTLSDDNLASLLSVLDGELNTALRDHPRNQANTQYTIPTLDSQGQPYATDTNILPLPTNMARLRSLVGPEGKDYKQYPPTLRGNIPDYSYIERGNCLEVYPTPTRGAMFDMDYYAFLRGLESDSDENWVSRYFANLYVYGMLKQVAIFTKDAKNLPDWRAQFETALAAAIRQGWGQNIGSSPVVRAA